MEALRQAHEWLPRLLARATTAPHSASLLRRKLPLCPSAPPHSRCVTSFPPPPFDDEEEAPRAAPPPQRPAPMPPPRPAPAPVEGLGDLPLRPASTLAPRPAPRPAPAEMAPPPQARPVPSNAPIQRVREPERATADPGGDEDLDDLDDPFADEDAPPPPPRGAARPAAPARPTQRKPAPDSLL